MTTLNGTPEDLPLTPPETPAVLGLWPTIFWGAGALVLFSGAQLAGALIYFFLFNQTHPDRPMALNEIAADGPLIAVVMLGSVPCLIGFVALALRTSRLRFRDYLALHRPHLRDYLIGLAGLAAVLALSSVLATLADVTTPGFMTGTFETGRNAGVLPLLALAFVVAAPVGEEVLFRGFLYRGLSARFGAPAAIAVTAVLWALLHIQYSWFFIVEIVTLGLFFGWMRWKSGSTLLTIALHATNNGLAMAALAAGIQ